MHALLTAAVALCAACANRSPYTCTVSDQCVLGGASGFCEPEGFCSFPDPECDGGRRFEPNAGNGLGGTCAMGVPDDAPPMACGAVGQPACSGEPACVAGTFSQDGTCQQCVTDVAIGHRYVCQTKYDKTIWCSGENTQGQLGNGVKGMPELIPTVVKDAAGPLTDVTALNMGYEVTCAVRGASGNVWCWGRGGDGQLGTGGTPMAETPVPVRVVMQNGMPLANIVQVDGGYGHMCGRDTNNEVWCWGRNGSGQLGNGTNLPANQNFATRVLSTMGGTPFTGATELFAGGDFTCVTKATDEIWCWGGNYDGQLGDNMTTDRLVPFTATRSRSASAGIFHLCAVNADSSVSCAGANYHAQLGNGTGGGFNGNDQDTLEKVLSAPGGGPQLNVAKVVAAGPMSCALMQDKTVKCWGDTFFGSTGTGTGSQYAVDVLARTPTGATKLEGVDKLRARYPRACAHTESGTWMCWGRGRSGEWGNNKVVDRGLAEPLTGVTCP
ncbi:MAG: hypothetical protein H0T46_36875 [Deltaproteobacteria bacterium]|nr:hypothetical protein [Deltaproteobacteria bacterium]